MSDGEPDFDVNVRKVTVDSSKLKYWGRGSSYSTRDWLRSSVMVCETIYGRPVPGKDELEDMDDLIKALRCTIEDHDLMPVEEGDVEWDGDLADRVDEIIDEYEDEEGEDIDIEVKTTPPRI